MATKEEKTIYDIEVTDISKNKFKIKKYQGHVMLIVNIATLCGLAKKSLAELSTLLVKHRSRGLKILLFPCSQLLTKSTTEFKNFVEKYSDDFILMSEVHVSGSKIHPLFEYLNGQITDFISSGVTHNFTYFLIDRQGNFVKKYLPMGKLLDNDSDLIKCIGMKDVVKECPDKDIVTLIGKLRIDFESESSD